MPKDFSSTLEKSTHRPNWTQQEIADKVELGRTAITEIVKNINFDKIDNDYESGKSISDVAQFHGLDIPVTWAILQEGKSDDERIESFLGQPPYLFNVWNFQDLDDRLGIHHEMNIPGQIALHYLYYFTKQGETILDPMAGGGCTL